MANTKTRKKAGRATPAAADKRTAPTVGKNTKTELDVTLPKQVAAWFRAKPHERYPLTAMAGIYGMGTALNAIHASPNYVGAAALVSVCGFVAASRKIRDGARAFKTCTLAAGTGIWVTIAGMTGTIGTDAPHIAMTAGFGVLSGAAYYTYRRDEVIRSKIDQRKQREAWPEFAAAVGLAGSVIEGREDTRLGERITVNIKGTGKRAAAIANGDVATRIAEHYRIPKSRVTVKEVPRDAVLVDISIRRVDPWKHAIKHPLLDSNPEITLPVPNDITAGPLVIGQDPETGDPLTLSVWDEDGARRTMVVAALGGGKTVLLNNVIERVTACRNAIVIGADLTKAKDLREWRKGGAVRIAACGPEEKGKAALILKAMRMAIDYRAANNRASVFQPGENRPAIVLVLDEIDGLVGGNSTAALAARENLTYIVSKGRSESIGVILVGQRGTAKWLGGADLRALLEQIVLLKVNRPREVSMATGGVDLNLPDMTTYGEGKAGVTLICKMDSSYDAGRTFKFHDLDDVLAISSNRTPTDLEPGLIEHLGDIYTQLMDGQPAQPSEDAATVSRLDAELEAMLPEELREQWQATAEKIDETKRYAAELKPVEEDLRVTEAARIRREQFAEQAKAAGVPAAARERILALATAPSGVANRIVAKTLDVSAATAHRYLSALGAEGLIEMRGKGRGAAWHAVTDSPDADEDLDAE
jgi:hypothetical protein